MLKHQSDIECWFEHGRQKEQIVKLNLDGQRHRAARYVRNRQQTDPLTNAGQNMEPTATPLRPSLCDVAPAASGQISTVCCTPLSSGSQESCATLLPGESKGEEDNDDLLSWINDISCGDPDIDIDFSDMDQWGWGLMDLDPVPDELLGGVSVVGGSTGGASAATGSSTRSKPLIGDVALEQSAAMVTAADPTLISFGVARKMCLMLNVDVNQAGVDRDRINLAAEVACETERVLAQRLVSSWQLSLQMDNSG